MFLLCWSKIPPLKCPGRSVPGDTGPRAETQWQPRSPKHRGSQLSAKGLSSAHTCFPVLHTWCAHMCHLHIWCIFLSLAPRCLQPTVCDGSKLSHPAQAVCFSLDSHGRLSHRVPAYVSQSMLALSQPEAEERGISNFPLAFGSKPVI